MQRRVVSRLAPALVAIIAPAVAAEQTDLRTFALPSGVEVSVPSTWAVANEEQLRAYQDLEDKLLKEKGIEVPLPPELERVSFQAAADQEPDSLRVTITLLPGEATQEEVAAWSPNVIQGLGEMLGDAKEKAIGTLGVRDAVSGPASRVDVGDKQAVYFTMTFTGPDGRKYMGEHYFIYTSQRTVIYTTQVGFENVEATAAERRRILESLRIR